MNYQEQTEKLILEDEFRMNCLRAARALSLPDWYLGAGFLRNAIWDCCHNKDLATPLNDIDLVYFDAEDLSRETEQQLESQLKLCFPAANWEVRNQARMHIRHGHLPYNDTAEGISQWIEVPTCVGVRMEGDDKLFFYASFGLEENWSLKVRMNPNNPKPDVFQQRIVQKCWLANWPNLKVECKVS